MRKLTAVILAWCLLMTAFAAVADEVDDPTVFFDSYTSRVGRIYFTMHTAPDAVIHEMDIDRASVGDAFQGICIGWKNKQQLVYMAEECEWQYHIAEISGTIAEAREVFAGKDEMDILGNALVHFSVLTVSFTGADVEALDLKLLKKTADDVTLPMVTIDYEYDDMPGVPYRCVGLLDGNRVNELIYAILGGG